MPTPTKGEDKEHYIGRCIRIVRREGKHKDMKAVAGKCYGMWDFYSKKGK